MSIYTIGQLAAKTGVSTDTIRIYEEMGLIEKPLRSNNGYRQYNKEAAARLRFIIKAKLMGFTLKEIGELLALKYTSSHTCEDVRYQAEVKLSDIEKKLDSLLRLKLALNTLIHSCHNKKNSERCPILSALEEETDG